MNKKNFIVHFRISCTASKKINENIFRIKMTPVFFPSSNLFSNIKIIADSFYLFCRLIITWIFGHGLLLAAGYKNSPLFRQAGRRAGMKQKSLKTIKNANRKRKKQKGRKLILERHKTGIKNILWHSFGIDWAKIGKESYRLKEIRVVNFYGYISIQFQK